MRQLDIETFATVTASTARYLNISKCQCTQGAASSLCVRHTDKSNEYPSHVIDNPLDRRFHTTEKQLQVENDHNLELREHLQKLVAAQPTDA